MSVTVKELREFIADKADDLEVQIQMTPTYTFGLAEPTKVKSAIVEEAVAGVVVEETV